MAIIRETAVIVADAMVDFTPAEEGKAVFVVKALDVAGGAEAYATKAAASSAAGSTGVLTGILVRCANVGEPVEVAVPGCGAIIEARCGGAVTSGAQLAAGDDGTLTVAGSGATAIAPALAAGEADDLVPAVMK